MLKKVSPFNRGLIVFALVYISLNFVDDFLSGVVQDAKLNMPEGRIQSVNSHTEVVNSESLPLVLGLPESVSGKTLNNINEDLFYRNKISEEKNEPVSDVKIVTEKPSYVSILKEKIRIQSISSSGVIINGRFYGVGNDIYEASIITNKGNRVLPKLVSISSNLDVVTLVVDGERIRISVKG